MFIFYISRWRTPHRQEKSNNIFRLSEVYDLHVNIQKKLTMDMFNKLRSAVSSALPGNPLSKDFDVLNHIASGGPGLVWKIYNAIKKTTKQEAAVFVFEKKLLEKYSRRDKELIVETLKKGISQLTRLRHPKNIVSFTSIRRIKGNFSLCYRTSVFLFSQCIE
ncbi:SCYL2 [Mytilus coruscus]|uniref:SCYL2 n=1 Tax=Mytilus coruscus TaxID=42192 RepID=A0A6J8ALW4_MYTCO|nr:SCYL2 [Mytilus coruscus]